MINPTALEELTAELKQAEAMFPSFHSVHQGYAVILEELDELWDEIRKKPEDRDPAKLRAEAVQVAAMAIRFVNDLCFRDTAGPAYRSVS